MREALKSVATALLLAMVFLLGQATVAHAQDWRKTAEGREVDCQLQVKGKTYLNGTCIYDADKDGSFRLFGDKYFVYLGTLDDGYANVSWNGTAQASHAQELLGEDFKRTGACWVGKQAKVCAWDKTADKPKSSKQAAERIKFAKGAVSAVVSGKLSGFDAEKNYVIEVGKGQTLKVEQLDKKSTGSVSLYITDPKGENANDMDLSCHSRATVKPTLAGDYKIQVVECQKADPWNGKFAFKITVK